MKDLTSHFLLRKDIHFLNFGSFGATPGPVFEKYREWQLLLEAEPVQFIAFDGQQYLANSRAALAEYINCPDPDDLVYVTNPSYAINTIANSLPLQPGDEVLSTNIEYGACDRAWDFHCNRKQATYRRQKITLPLVSKEQFLKDLFAGVNERTKVLFISHITSTTGVILPVKEACEEAKARGLLTIVDGAHVPGHIPFDLSSIRADFYTGACHKWMMAPKGCSFLYAEKAFQQMLDPLVVSWGYRAAKPSHSQFLDYHQMTGTRDFSAFLTVPACIEFMAAHDWRKVARDCHNMVIGHAGRFFALLETEPVSPLDDQWIGQMISIPIKSPEPEMLQRRLFTQYRIEVPLMRQEDDVYIRYSINAFNAEKDLDALHTALAEIKSEGTLIR